MNSFNISKAAIAGALLISTNIAAAQNSAVIGDLHAEGNVTIGHHPTLETVANTDRGYENGKLIATDPDSTARIQMNNGNGRVTVGTNTEATVQTGPGYLVIADGDRIDFEFKTGIPYAIEMDCYIVRPHPLQPAGTGNLVSGSIIRDEDGSYVLGRGGRIDVTVNRRYLDMIRDFDRKADDGNRRRYSDATQPDRVHTLINDERFEGCGGGAGLIAALPETCGVNTGSRIGSVVGAVGTAVAAIAGGGSSSPGAPDNSRNDDPPASGSSGGSGSSSGSGSSTSSGGSGSPGIPSAGSSGSGSSGGDGGSGSSGGASSSGASGGKGSSGSSGGTGGSGSSGGKDDSGSSGGKGDECGDSDGYKPKDPVDPPASPVKGKDTGSDKGKC